MTVYVETIADGGWFGLMAADEEGELHSMASRLGVSLAACLRHRDDALGEHRCDDAASDVRYWLTPDQRRQAIEAGASPVTESVLARMRARRRRSGRLPNPAFVVAPPMRPRAELAEAA